VGLSGADWELHTGDDFGRYRVEGVLGEGGVGTVYEASLEGHDGRLALKVLKPNFATDSEYRRRFLHEARAATTIDHPHVVRVLDAGEVDGRPFLAMPFVSGVALDKMLRMEGVLSVRQVVMLAQEVGSALDALHAAGLIHRDVKPGNVILDGNGHASLTDFGFAKGSEYETLTAAGQVVGTLLYMAPERLRGERAVPASDIYSLGCTLYECATGERPFDGVDQMQIFLGHLEEEPPNPCWCRPQLPEAFGQALCMALAKDPAERPPSATAYAEVLARSAESG
jgi:serine/threonine-protein kinase